MYFNAICFCFELNQVTYKSILTEYVGTSAAYVSRIVNSSFEITYNDVTKLYHLECESSKYDVFVDLPCGYTPRPIEMAEQGVTYIGLDLPPVISEISDIIPSLISGEKQNLVRFCPADATNGESLEKALEDVKGSICINTEGLLMYLNDSETNSFLDNIRKLLSIHGGCWITADIEVMPEHNRIPCGYEVICLTDQGTARCCTKGCGRYCILEDCAGGIGREQHRDGQ